jgi:hypothetical protein
MMKRSAIIYRGITFWNDLDIKYKKLNSLKTFKHYKLKRSMLEQIYKQIIYLVNLLII